MLLKLFTTFFKIGLFSFGGGFAMIPLIQREVIQRHKWIDGKDFVDMLVLAQSTPGPIAVNTAVLTAIGPGVDCANTSISTKSLPSIHL